METLESNRLQLREWEEIDAKDVFEYAKSKLVGPMAGWKPHDSLEESLEIIQMFKREQDTWAIVLKETGKVIGSVGLHKEEKEKERMLGYVLGEDYWGQGIFKEASERILAYGFEQMKLERITVYHFSTNRQSKRVIEKLGFTYEESKKNGTTGYDGTFYDKVCYVMTISEYYQRKREGLKNA